MKEKELGIFNRSKIVSSIDVKDNLNILVQQWVAAYEMAIEISKMQITTNNFFTAILSLLIGGVLFSGINVSLSNTKYHILITVVCIVGIVLCVIWIFQLLFLKKLNNCKYAIIREIEKHLPAKVLSKEYYSVYYKKNRYFSNLQIFVPVIYVIAFVTIELIYVL